MGTIRSFIAIPVKGLPKIDRILDEIGRIRGIKGISPENVHLTLKFLGDIDVDHEVPEISEILTEIAGRHDPFSLLFHNTGAFPTIPSMRVAWIGIQSPEIISLAKDVIQSLPPRPGEKKQSFRGHLTIGRVKFQGEIDRARRLLEQNTEQEFGTLNVEEFHLIKSDLTPHGPIYHVIERFSLGAPRDS
jgi:RNA 2',3'-cyclic 3'-phosphodiesterase